MITDKQMDLAMKNMKLRKDPTGTFPMIAVVPRDAVPRDVPGTISIAEGGAIAMRAGLADYMAAVNDAQEKGDETALAEATETASEMVEMWLAVELSFAGVLLRHGKKLKGRSMIVMK